MRQHTIVVCGGSAPVCKRLLLALGDDACRIDKLADLQRWPSGQLGRVVLSWGPNLAREFEARTDLLPIIATLLRDVATIVVIENPMGRMQQVMKLAKLLPGIEILIDGIDAVHTCLTLDTGLDKPSGYADIHNGLSEILSPDLDAILAAGVVAGRRRRLVKDFAATCSMSVRTLEVRLRDSRGPYPRELLSWILSLHIMWRMDVLGNVCTTTPDA